MVGESNQNAFLIQIDASSFAEFKISEFEISRFDCIRKFECHCKFSSRLVWFYKQIHVVIWRKTTHQNVTMMVQPEAFYMSWLTPIYWQKNSETACSLCYLLCHYKQAAFFLLLWQRKLVFIVFFPFLYIMVLLSLQQKKCKCLRRHLALCI